MVLNSPKAAPLVHGPREIVIIIDSKSITNAAMHHHLSLFFFFLKDANALSSSAPFQKENKKCMGPTIKLRAISHSSTSLRRPRHYVSLLVFPVKFFFNSIPAMNLPHKRHVGSLVWGVVVAWSVTPQLGPGPAGEADH